MQLGLLPEMDREAPDLFTASERIMQDFARDKKLNATFIKDLIQKVLHHPDFDPDEVDYDIISKSGGNYLIIICNYLNYLKTRQLFENYLIIIW